jgi:putative hemin transport protein
MTETQATPTIRTHDPDHLAARWTETRAQTPKLRIRDAAEALGVSELELVVTNVGATVTRLAGEPAAMVRRLPDLGRAMALTRNPHAVSEVRGRYDGVEVDGRMGQVVGEHIDLRLFLWRWSHAVAIAEPDGSGGTRRSIQFFDDRGTAVHKAYAEDPERVAAFDAFVAEFRAPAQDRAIGVVADPVPDPAPPASLDVPAFHAAWDAMQDTHEFFPLLRRFGLMRGDAYRHAGERARPAALGALAALLDAAVAAQTKIMIFVGNQGCLQVFSGAVHRVLRTGPWLNVMDPGFNLHLREDRVASAWVVAKPTKSGIVRSLELLDDKGEAIALVFRKRDDRAKPEDPDWSKLLAAVTA